MGLGRIIFVAAAITAGALFAYQTIDDAVAHSRKKYEYTSELSRECRGYIPVKLGAEAQVLFNSGVDARKAGNLSESIGYFKEAAEAEHKQKSARGEPESALPTYRLGFVYEYIGFLKANLAIAQEKEGDEKKAEASRILAVENLNLASTVWKKAISIEPCYAESYQALSRLYANLDDCINTISFCQKFLEIKTPYDPAADIVIERMEYCKEQLQNQQEIQNQGGL